MKDKKEKSKTPPKEEKKSDLKMSNRGTIADDDSNERMKPTKK